MSVVCPRRCACWCLFCFNDAATTEIYTLSLHDALPIYHAAHVHAGDPGVAREERRRHPGRRRALHADQRAGERVVPHAARSEEHTSELQSRQYLLCRLLLEKKKTERCDNALPPNSTRRN